MHTRPSREPKNPANGAWSVASFSDRILRSLWLRLLSRALDGQLKSPSFLVWMRYGIDITTALRRLHGAPGRASPPTHHR